MSQLLGNILFALTNMGGCNHNHTSTPYTARGSKECHVTCLDCGARALYDPFKFIAIGQWEKKVVQTNRSEIIPHVYSLAGNSGVLRDRSIHAMEEA